jgi:CheY-like chemotaxis protein
MSREERERAGTEPAVSPVGSSGDSGTVRVDDERRRKIRHDLRSPINQILGFSEMLREDAEAAGLDAFVQDLLKIETAARTMIDLVDEFASAHVATAPPAPAQTGAASRRPLLRSRGPLAQSKAEPKKGRILAVDDDALNREMVSRRLCSLGYQVETAADGPSALGRLERERFDLILLDVVMPDVSGLEVLATIRAQYDRGDLPVIMTTALDASSDVVEALGLGANDYVTKPLDLAVVVARIDTQLGLKEARDKVRELNQRLDAAQNRMASLADGTAGEAGALARSIAREIGDALGAVEVVAWVLAGDQLEACAESAMAAPDPRELEVLRAKGRTYRDSAALLSIAGPSGKLLGVVGVAIGREAFAEAEEELVQNFVRHLGSMLELGAMRSELARTAEQRRATREQLIQRGVDLLHLCPLCSRCYPHTIEFCEEDGASVHAMSRAMPFRVRQRYRLLRLVGEGGMGTVFRARDERLERDVAIKLIKADLFHNDTVRLRFEHEARAVARIEHPSVIAIFDSGEAEEGSLYMVMEWLPGRDLGQVIEQQGPGSPKQVVSVLRQVSSALHAAHRAQLVHRDIKPDNVFVHAEGNAIRAKVLDFGVVKAMADDTRLTQTGSLVGTPLYMSPEQVMNKPVDAKSDTYSLAAVAFEALTGERVVSGESFAEVVLAVAGDEAPRLSSKLAGVSQELDEAFGRGLAKNPADRPATVVEWVNSIATLLERVPPSSEWLL